jgi:transposase
MMCDAAGVVLAFLPPYSPDLNPIEEFFSELKAWIKRNNELISRFDNFC